LTASGQLYFSKNNRPQAVSSAGFDPTADAERKRLFASRARPSAAAALAALVSEAGSFADARKITFNSADPSSARPSF
jgi:hypothetical protein